LCSPVSRVYAEYLFKMTNGLLKSPLLRIEYAKVVMDLHEIGLQVSRLLIMDNCLL
jgi:hypothetical protein